MYVYFGTEEHDVISATGNLVVLAIYCNSLVCHIILTCMKRKLKAYLLKTHKLGLQVPNYMKKKP